MEVSSVSTGPLSWGQWLFSPPVPQDPPWTGHLHHPSTVGQLTLPGLIGGEREPPAFLRVWVMQFRPRDIDSRTFQLLLCLELLGSLYQGRDRAALGPLRRTLTIQDWAESAELRGGLLSLASPVIIGAQSPQTLGLCSDQRGEAGGEGSPAGQHGEVETAVGPRHCLHPVLTLREEGPPVSSSWEGRCPHVHTPSWLVGREGGLSQQA